MPPAPHYDTDTYVCLLHLTGAHSKFQDRGGIIEQVAAEQRLASHLARRNYGIKMDLYILNMVETHVH